MIVIFNQYICFSQGGREEDSKTSMFYFILFTSETQVEIYMLAIQPSAILLFFHIIKIYLPHFVKNGRFFSVLSCVSKSENNIIFI